jgi:hypothetical protein
MLVKRDYSIVDKRADYREMVVDMAAEIEQSPNTRLITSDAAYQRANAAAGVRSLAAKTDFAYKSRAAAAVASAVATASAVAAEAAEAKAAKAAEASGAIFLALEASDRSWIREQQQQLKVANRRQQLRVTVHQADDAARLAALSAGRAVLAIRRMQFRHTKRVFHEVEVSSLRAKAGTPSKNQASEREIETLRRNFHKERDVARREENSRVEERVVAATAERVATREGEIRQLAKQQVQQESAVEITSRMKEVGAGYELAMLEMQKDAERKLALRDAKLEAAISAAVRAATEEGVRGQTRLREELREEMNQTMRIAEEANQQYRQRVNTLLCHRRALIFLVLVLVIVMAVVASLSTAGGGGSTQQCECSADCRNGVVGVGDDGGSSNSNSTSSSIGSISDGGSGGSSNGSSNGSSDSSSVRRARRLGHKRFDFKNPHLPRLGHKRIGQRAIEYTPCSAGQPCGGSEFCNYDSVKEGTCESCYLAGMDFMLDCDAAGLPASGAEDCRRRCTSAASSA